MPDKEGEKTKRKETKNERKKIDIPKLPEEIKSIIERENLGFEQYSMDLDYSYWTAGKKNLREG